jgi:cob(I)alamin adenosyltransferase
MAQETPLHCQFVKGMHYNELNALKLIPNITIRQYGLDCFIKNQPTDKDIAAALKGLEEIKIRQK